MTDHEALAPTEQGDAPEAEPRGVEYHRLKASARQALFGGASDPVRIGRFTVLRRLGEGGMGVVYSAYDDELERKVAIKLVRPELALDDAQLRMRREAQAAARLSHPNVVAVYEIGEHRGRLFVAMEFVRGQTLTAWLAASPRPWTRIVDVFIDAGHGLAAAHRAGLVHRDFKPDNVMIDDDGRARVLDFGVARVATATTPSAAASTSDTSIDEEHASTEPGDTALTGAGAIIGTPAYMAPEQLRGEIADARSDQYALCLSMWRALFQESPFGREDDDLRRRAEARMTGTLRTPTRATAVPARIRRLLERGLAPRPEDRHASMDALIAALVSARHRPQRWGIALVATAVASIGLGVVWGSRDDAACSAERERFDAVWGAQPREALDAAVRANVGPDAEPAWTELATALDDFTGAWRTSLATACETDDEEALQQRRCLASRASDARDLAQTLATADATAITASLRAVQAWEPPDACLDPERLRKWAELDALRDAPPPPGSEHGLVSDFDGEPPVHFGFGWVRSTDELIEGNSEATVSIASGGAHGSAGALKIEAIIREPESERPAWAGAMYFPGAQPMATANLTTLPRLSFMVRGTPGSYAVVLFTQSKDWDGRELPFEVGDEWRQVTIDLRDLGAPLYDVTGIYIGRDEPGAYSCAIDDVRLDAATP